jgi:hypothetical protein
MLTAQASGAQVEPFRLTIDGDSNRMNIGHPLTVGVPFRVAYVMTELRCFATYIALQDFSPLTI